MYYSPVLCNDSLTVFPAWVVDNGDESMKQLCALNQKEINTLLNSGKLPKYMIERSFSFYKYECHRNFFSEDYANTMTIVISVLVLILSLVQFAKGMNEPHSKAANIVIITTTAITGILSLLCIVWDSKELRYKLDI